MSSSGAHRKAHARAWAKTHGQDFVEHAAPDPHHYPELAGARTLVNNRYMVLVRDVATPWGQAKHLHIQRLDTKRIHSWRELQDVKNAIAGADAVAVEMYPAEGQVIDNCHHYHLWVLPAGLELPFSLGSVGA